MLQECSRTVSRVFGEGILVIRSQQGKKIDDSKTVENPKMKTTPIMKIHLSNIEIPYGKLCNSCRRIVLIPIYERNLLIEGSVGAMIINKEII